MARPIAIFPNSGGAHKEWKEFPELTAGILAAIPGSVVAWDSHREWDDPVVCNPSRLINLTTRTSLLEMVELIRRARLVIANDSGPLHIAAALGPADFGALWPDSAGEIRALSDGAPAEQRDRCAAGRSYAIGLPRRSCAKCARSSPGRTSLSAWRSALVSSIPLQRTILKE